MQKITLLLVDDHQVVRQGLRALLGCQADLEVVGEAASGREAVAAVEKLKPDVVIMDLAMPLLNGMEATRQIVRACPGTKVVALSSYADREHVQQSLDAGAAAYLLKHTASADLITAIHQVHGGQSYFSPAIAQQMREGEPGSEPGAEAAAETKLSPREAEVLQLIAEGMANKQIASELNLSIKTVEKHREALMQKLNLHCIPDLVRYAVSRKTIEMRNWKSA